MAVFEKEFKNFFDIVTRLNILDSLEQDTMRSYFSHLSDNKLYVVLYDRKHDVNHAIRTTLYTHLLCTKKGIDKKYYNYVMLAAMYHDCGLDRNRPKETHGIDGANIFEKCNPDMNKRDVAIIRRLIALHTSESNELDLSGLNIKSKKQIAELNKIYCILKDADAIDRNRLDYSFTKCKPRALRFPESKALLETADNVLFEYKKKEYVMPNLDNKAKFEYYYKIYVNFAKKYLPVKNEVIAKKLTSSLKIENELGERAKELFRVPAVLFYGSTSNFELIKEKSGKEEDFHLICSDSPLQSFFRTVFQNDVEVGISIKEYFDENGEYVVKYHLDEYVKGAIEKTIAGKKIMIHVLDGNMFYKATEGRYNTRDWTSRNYRNIYAMDKFEIDVKEFFNSLMDNKVLTYSPWSPGKEIPNIISIMKTSYIPRLLNEEPESDKDLNDIIDKYYPNQKEFVKYFKEDIYEILDRLKASTYNIKYEEIEEFITDKFQYKNNQDEYVYNSKRISDYIESKKKVAAEPDKKTNVVKIVAEEDLSSVEEKEKSPVQGYIAMILLSIVIGLLIGAILAISYYLIVR